MHDKSNSKWAIVTRCSDVVLLQGPPSHGVLVSVLILLLWGQFDHVIDSEDGYGGLGGKLEALELADGWFQDTGLLAVSQDSFH